MADDSININIEGLSELDAKLADLGTKVAERCIRAALKAGAQIEQAAITERAPVKVGDGGILPDGALKSDIVIKMKRDENGQIVAVVGPDSYTSHVANWVEYGHRMVTGGRNTLDKATGKTKGPGKHIDEVPEHPFIRPAYEATREEVANAICTTLAESIEKASVKSSK
jgi:HK97 gp10 family phage protein